MSNPPPISPEAENDYDELLNRMVPMIEHWLEERDGFIPCGAAVSTDGELVGVMVGPEEDSTLESILQMLVDTLKIRAREGEIRASCACFDGGFEDDGADVPAIVIILEHVRGPATMLYRPYRKSEDGTYEYADLIGQSVPSEIFAGE